MNENRKVGVMIACGYPKRVAWLKKFILDLEKMHYNLLELEITCSYKIENEPYFGYLLGGYTKEELQEVDEFAKEHGIELVPCIQTLAHLDPLVRIPKYYPFIDIDDILLIDDERTYELIENMFRSLRESFSTKHINIGYDEAHKVGRGRYLDKHGYVRGFDLLIKHLDKVVEIAEKYGFKIHMWSDMFVRLANGGGYYGKGIEVPKDVLARINPKVDLVYWDYGEHALEEDFFDAMFTTHDAFSNNVWYSPCAWLWMGFAPFNRFSLRVGEMAMKQAHKHGVKDFLVTLWGNDGNEGAYYSVLPSLYALRQYIDGNFDEQAIAKGFEETFGVNFHDFLLLDIPNKTSRNEDGVCFENPCKTLLYNDCFLGYKDSELLTVDTIDYAAYAHTLTEVAERMGEYQPIFETLAQLCKVLAQKAYLGIRTREAYQAGDKEALLGIVEDYKQTAKRVETFIRRFRTQWLAENKPHGWQIHQIRLGGLYARILDCKRRLEDYLDGVEESIPELEEKILPFDGSLTVYGYQEAKGLRGL